MLDKRKGGEKRNLPKTFGFIFEVIHIKKIFPVKALRALTRWELRGRGGGSRSPAN